jgi:hypothetical protein
MNPYINTSDIIRDDLDVLAEVLWTTVRGDQLKEGMVLVDPVLHTPEAELDKKVTSVRGSGAVRFLLHDLNDNSLRHEMFMRNKRWHVMAA